MRGVLGRRKVVLAVVATTAVIAGAGVALTRSNTDGDPPGRPRGAVGEWVQIVGGGRSSLSLADERTLVGTDVALQDRLQSMAVDDDGTLWLLDISADLYSVGRDGTITAHGQVFYADEIVASQIGPNGFLYVAAVHGHGDQTVTRIDLRTFETSEAQIAASLGEASVRGMTIAANGQVYIADSRGVAYGLDVNFGPVEVSAEAEPLAGTPPAADDCPRRASGSDPDEEHLVGIAATSNGEVTVADPVCGWAYQPGMTPPTAPDAPGCTEGETRAGEALDSARGTLVIGYRCRIVWQVDPDGQTDVLVRGDDNPRLFRMAAALDDDTLYVMDQNGVWGVRLPDPVG